MMERKGTEWPDPESRKGVGGELSSFDHKRKHASYDAGIQQPHRDAAFVHRFETHKENLHWVCSYAAMRDTTA